MKLMLKCFLPVTLTLSCLVGVGNASTAVIGSDTTGTPLVVYGITSFTTTGADMALSGGLQVTVNFANASTGAPVGSPSTAVFVAGCGTGCGSASGSVFGGGTWTLTQTGNTGSVGDASNPDSQPINFWTLSTTGAVSAIASVQLMGGPTNGNVVFDRDRATGTGATTGGQIGTPGSAFGIDFVTSTTSIVPPSPPPADSANFLVNVTYSNIVRLAGAAGSRPCQNAAGGTAVSGPFAGLDSATTGCGDTWQNLTFSFSPATAFAGTSTFHFFQDTDMIGTPEPVSLALMSGGLLLIATLYRRRQKRLV